MSAYREVLQDASGQALRLDGLVEDLKWHASRPTM